MAQKYWIGTATAVAQVSTVQITAFDAATTYTITIGGVEVEVTGNTDVNTTASDLQVALEASTHPYFEAVTWTVATDTVTGTAGTAGVPFVATSSVTGGTGTIGAVTTSTASSGPNDWSTADNWSDGSIPANNDDVFIDKTDAIITWGLDQNAVGLGELHVRRNAKIGLASSAFGTSVDGETTDATAAEYRQDYLKLGYDLCLVGEIVGPATVSLSTRVKIHNNQTTDSATIVHGTASAASESDVPAAARFLFDDADADLYVLSAIGGCGVAVDKPTETSTIGEFHVLDTTSRTRCYTSQGVTLTKWQQAGGINSVKLAAALATTIADGGELRIGGDQIATSVEVNGSAQVYLNNRGAADVACTTLTQNDGEVWFTEDNRPVVVTTYNFYGGRREMDRHVTLTNDNRQNRRSESVSPV